MTTTTKGNLEITNMLTLSTAHIKEETAKMLDAGKDCITVFSKGGYGWFIYVDKEVLEENKNSLPNDLLATIQLADENNCNWLCLDCDGEITEALPTYEW